MVRHAAEFRRQRAGRALAVFFVGSVAAHAAVLVVIPARGEERGLPGNVVALEVVLRADPLAAVPHEFAPTRVSHQSRPERRPVEASPRLPGAPGPVPSEPWEMEGASITVESARVPEPAVAAPELGPAGAAVARPPQGVSAAYLRNPAPSYPLASRRAGEEGTVTLRVLVGRDGLASRVAVEKSSGSPHLDAAALEAVKAWRFTPARQGAERIESWMLVPVVFRLEG